MAGILNSKQRLLDTIITQEGRRQVAGGALQIMFASFTDRHTFYEGDTSGAVTDASDRIFLEAGNRPQDQITIEMDDEGRMKAFTGGNVEISGNKLLKPGAATSASPLGKRLEVVTGSQVIADATTLLQTTAQNFTEQYIIGTKDIFSETSGFTIVPNSYTFKITDEVPMRTRSRWNSRKLLKYRKKKGYAGRGRYAIDKASINDVESLYEDMRLSHLASFQYMPPVNRPSPGNTVGRSLGHYESLNQAGPMTFSGLKRSLAGKESVELNFSDTSTNNVFISQILDVRPNSVEKLAIIDFGSFVDDDPHSPGKRVFFAGRIFMDDNDSPTFVNIFTIVFD